MPALMYARATFITVLALYMLFAFSCKREYSYEGGDGAIYSFVGAPDSCIGAVVLGSYYEDIPVDSSNAVQLKVHVSRAGTYDIKTDGVNGLGFSLSGTFTDTGMQVITLPAKGVSATSGTFLVKIPGGNGCYFSVTAAPKPPSSYTLDGAPDDCAGTRTQGVYISGQTLTDDNAVTVLVNVLTPGAYAITTDSANGVYFADTGSFATAGKQQIVLHGHGNAHSAGLYYFNVLNANSPCGFYLPVQNIGPPAVYVLQSSIINNIITCTPGSVQGVYITNTPVVAANTATISINVTQTGNYTIATNRVNGVTFQYSGTIATAGVQQVVLFASGTPKVTGTFLYTAQIIGPAPSGGAACSFDVTTR